MTKAAKLREILGRDGLTVFPGAYDAHSALLAQEAGFPTVYLGGFSISAGSLGYPDWGFATMDEMLSVAVKANNALDVPIVCDIDQGFGALTNFVRTVQTYERAGIAGIHFEDQPFPKKCSQQSNREVISLEDATAKVRAAVEARRDPDFVLIARTDSKSQEGLSGLMRRMESYLEAGADYCIFCEQETEEELEAVAKEFPGKVIAFVGDAPDNQACCLPVSAYEEMGYKGLFYCALGITAAHRQMKHAFSALRAEGHLSSDFLRQNTSSLSDVQELAGMSDWQELRDRYAML